MIRRLDIFARDQRGAAVIEMGLMAPIFATLLIAAIDLSDAYSTKLQIEQAAQRTIEKVQGSTTTFTSTQIAALRADAAAAAGVATTAATVRTWRECNGVRQGNVASNSTPTGFTDSCPTGQVTARYVELDVEKTFTPMFPLRFRTGGYTLHGIAGLRVP
jgi:Flp pilus assembly protein TadG